MIEVFRYQTEEGAEPMTDWLQSLRDKQAQAKIRVRLKRLEGGNFGDCDPVGNGVLELREHVAQVTGCTLVGMVRRSCSCCAVVRRDRRRQISGTNGVRSCIDALVI